jgi:signal transduction histidine kinase
MLLVEDDHVDQMAFKRLVRNLALPYDCEIASSVKEAREVLRHRQFDIIVADFFLGDGTSFDFLEDCGDTPFIVVTGTGTEETAVEMMKRGARDYLIKDSEGKYLTVLPATVKNALDRKAAEDELREHRQRLEDLVRERTAKLEAEVQDRLRAEREKGLLQEQLHQAQKMEAVGQLAAGVAHDFNNLLTVIAINAERVKTRCSDQEMTEAVDMILESVEQATGVTKSLLTFCREIPGDKKRINLREVVRRSANLLMKLLPASIEFVVVNETDGWIQGDATQIQQVILNLAINARDAMPEGGRLRIELSTVGAGIEGTPPVSLVVSDTGIGMSAQVKARMFDPFFTTKTRGQGTGLGLAIVHGILQDHEAKVQVNTAVGQGTEFVITFPAALPKGEADQAPERPQPQRGTGQQILIAEDHPSLRSLIDRALTEGGYHPIVTKDGAELLEEFDKLAGKVSLIIVDLEMPRLGGRQCIEALRGRNCDVPFLVITGNPTKECELPADFHDRLLLKPFSIGTLMTRVDELLSQVARTTG